MDEKLLPPGEVCRRLGIHYVTLKRWIYSSRIRAVRTPSGRWMIPESEIEKIISGEVEAKEVKAIIYARVSSSDQRNDLERQIQYLTQYCSAKGYEIVDVLRDVASGLRTNRRDLLKLFNYVVNGQVDVVVVTYKDRLTGFGFEYLGYFFKQYGVGIEVAYGEEPKFTGKLYGMRSRRRKKLIGGFRKVLEEVEENG
ncbi:IS607 family transposase [Caldivirga maquilingensis]|uniref:Resolvase domain n=1 Tax=Caldivirga maquilingensis (strain ATCC 700844 / DSM 13496 / JCM 10307 / IC-167) TaxID=397948 RepID=A8MD21_CALMQ|nr:IS607 family transposase [Caldivirga maquilingensis]ABW01677.1 Resolvase domain [Caldivirga maquilingensis IC-167]